MPILKLITFKSQNPCLKQEVKALIINIHSQEVYGSNHIKNKIESCPRVEQNCATGVGYELCKSVCNQGAHAEIDAINQALEKNINIENGTLYLIGHSYCCENCISHMKSAKLKKAIVLNDIGNIIQEYNF